MTYKSLVFSHLTYGNQTGPNLSTILDVHVVFFRWRTSFATMAEFAILIASRSVELSWHIQIFGVYCEVYILVSFRDLR
jgi:hypothetical protein